MLCLVTGSEVDIAFAVTCYAKYSIYLGMARWCTFLRILRYLGGTNGYATKRCLVQIQCSESIRLSVRF